MGYFKVYPGVRSDSYASSRVGYVSERTAGKRYTANQYYQSNSYQMTPMQPPHFGLRASDAVFNTRLPPTSSDYNRLYAKVRSTVEGEKGELLTSMVEWNSSLRMITARARTLAKAYRALRVFNLPEVARVLTLGTRQRRIVEKRIRKYTVRPRPTQLWLEYWMGWAPLVGDIGLALNKLTDNVNHQPRFSVGITSKESAFELYAYSTASYVTNRRLAAYGRMKVTNPNLGLAHQLGFTNPVLTAWQTLPFSFIVDWFTNVGQVLGSMDDFLGVELTQTGVSLYQETTYSGTERQLVFENDELRMLYYAQTGVGIRKMRTPGPIPRPQLVVGLPKLSLTRASTAISLLVELFLIKSTK